MVERQDPDNFTRFQTRERCALEIAAYVFNERFKTGEGSNPTRLIFFHEGDIFKISLLLKQDFLSYFCYILIVFTIVFFECFFFVCVFCEFFF